MEKCISAVKTNVRKEMQIWAKMTKDVKAHIKHAQKKKSKWYISAVKTNVRKEMQIWAKMTKDVKAHAKHAQKKESKWYING